MDFGDQGPIKTSLKIGPISAGRWKLQAKGEPYISPDFVKTTFVKSKTRTSQVKRGSSPSQDGVQMSETESGLGQKKRTLFETYLFIIFV